MMSHRPNYFSVLGILVASTTPSWLTACSSSSDGTGSTEPTVTGGAASGVGGAAASDSGGQPPRSTMTGGTSSAEMGGSSLGGSSLGGSSATATGESPITSDGGSATPSSGGRSSAGTGGSSMGGASTTAAGGSPITSGGGSATPSSGGTTVGGSGGATSAGNSGGSTGSPIGTGGNTGSISGGTPGSSGNTGSAVGGTPGSAGDTAGGVGGAAGSAGDTAGTSGGAVGSGGSTATTPEASEGCGSPLPSDTCSDSPCNLNGLDFYVDLPEGHDPERPYPVVFQYHPLGGTAQQARTMYRVRPNFPDAIYVSPAGSDNGYPNTGGVDEEMTRAVIADIETKFCIDRARYFATGFSYGGSMSYTAGICISDMFRAIAPMAGATISGANRCTLQRPVAAWINHGSDDTALPISMSITLRDMILAENGCSQETVPVDPSPCVAYQGCDAGYPVIWCEQPGVGHAIPDYGAAAIAEFFKQF